MGDRFEKETRREKQRKLTPAEERRLARFDAICADLERQGYARADLTVGIVKANVFAVALAIPVFIIGFAAFAFANTGDKGSFDGVGIFVLLIAFIVLTVVHELIHGLTWSIFSQNGLKDIEFGFMKEYLTPYCTCASPLPLKPYIIGGLMPGIVLGVIPAIIAIAIGSFPLLIIGQVMTVAAAGDILVVIMLLRYRPTASERLIYDHPTQAGCVIFER